MKVPNSALEGCKDSFIAADERRTKASTKFFSDTGLMALLCRHDRVLWLANMTTAGESQFYSLALLRRLGQELPLTTHLGILYDIGCQLDRSCRKYGFLSELAGRMTFGVSVFMHMAISGPVKLFIILERLKGLACQMVKDVRDYGLL
jgi:hypothetical protein